MKAGDVSSCAYNSWFVLELYWKYKRRDEINKLFQECLRLSRKNGGIGAGDDIEKNIE